METYSALRQFADSWALLAMFLFFLGMVLMLFRPGNKQAHRDAANIPFRDEKHPDATPHTGNVKKVTPLSQKAEQEVSS